MYPPLFLFFLLTKLNTGHKSLNLKTTDIQFIQRASTVFFFFFFLFMPSSRFFCSNFFLLCSGTLCRTFFFFVLGLVSTFFLLFLSLLLVFGVDFFFAVSFFVLEPCVKHLSSFFCSWGAVFFSCLWR